MKGSRSVGMHGGWGRGGSARHGRDPQIFSTVRLNHEAGSNGKTLLESFMDVTPWNIHTPNVYTIGLSRSDNG